MPIDLSNIKTTMKNILVLFTALICLSCTNSGNKTATGISLPIGITVTSSKGK